MEVISRCFQNGYSTLCLELYAYILESADVPLETLITTGKDPSIDRATTPLEECKRTLIIDSERLCADY